MNQQQIPFLSRNVSRIISTPLLTLFLITTSAWADGGTYVDWKNANSDAVLPPPPKKGDLTDLSDYKKVLSLQKSRTEQDCARARISVEITLGHFFGPPYGPLTEEEVGTAGLFVEKLRLEVYSLIGQAKEKWKRPRPFAGHADILPCIQLEKSFSYPSGHAAIARLQSHILQVLFPKKKDAIAKRADQIAEERVLGGVHYPSDIEAGKKIADFAYTKLTDSQSFQKDLRLFIKVKDAQ